MWREYRIEGALKEPVAAMTLELYFFRQKTIC
jgi:hypothetical protein